MIKAYSIKVTTLDGAVHKSETMELQATEIRLAHEDPAPWETIAGSQVARIEIRRGRRAFDLTADGLITGGLATYSCAMGAFVFCVLGPGILAVSAASALITLIVDGVQLLIPPKVYEIVH